MAENAALCKNSLGGWQKIKTPTNGAGVLMRLRDVPCHVGIYWNGDVLHCDEYRKGVVRERVEDVGLNLVGYFLPKETTK